MSSAYLLGSHEIWLSDALEMVVTARWPEEGAAATASPNEDEQLRKYRAEKAKFDEYQEWERQKRDAESSPLGSLYLDHPIGSLNKLGASWLAPAPFKDPVEAPRATELIVSAFEKEIARNGLCDRAWTLLRQALRDDVLPAFCFLEVQSDEQFPAEAWGKPPNQKSHLTGKGYLRLNDKGGGLLGGRVYLRSADVKRFLAGESGAGETTDVQAVELEHPNTAPTPAPRPNVSLSTLKRALEVAKKFMASKKYRPLTKTEAELSILGEIFEGVSRDRIRDHVTGDKYPKAKRISPKLTVNRDREISDCREAVKVAIFEKKDI